MHEGNISTDRARKFIDEIAETLTAKLSKFGKVRKVRRQARIAKEAAEGAFIIGKGLAGVNIRVLLTPYSSGKLEAQCLTIF